MNTASLRHALQRTPPHLVLLLGPGRAALHLARGHALAAVQEAGFPLVQSGPGSGSTGNDEDLDTFMTRVDEALGSYRAAHPCPVVLAGPPDLVTAFADRSQNLYRLAGLVTGRAAESLVSLSAAAREAVEPYLLSREAEALWTLQYTLTVQPERVAGGLDDCRAAARRRQAELLVVEETTARAEGDVVAGLIEAVIDQGGWVALAHEGALEPQGGIAVVLNPPTALEPDD